LNVVTAFFLCVRVARAADCSGAVAVILAASFASTGGTRTTSAPAVASVNAAANRQKSRASKAAFSPDCHSGIRCHAGDLAPVGARWRDGLPAGRRSRAVFLAGELRDARFSLHRKRGAPPALQLEAEDAGKRVLLWLPLSLLAASAIRFSRRRIPARRRSWRNGAMAARSVIRTIGWGFCRIAANGAGCEDDALPTGWRVSRLTAVSWTSHGLDVNRQRGAGNEKEKHDAMDKPAVSAAASGSAARNEKPVSLVVDDVPVARCCKRWPK
jgi:hypothetical protein